MRLKLCWDVGQLIDAFFLKWSERRKEPLVPDVAGQNLLNKSNSHPGESKFVTRRSRVSEHLRAEGTLIRIKPK